MPSLAYILAIGGPVLGWVVIAWFLVRTSGKPRLEHPGEPVSGEPGAPTRP